MRRQLIVACTLTLLVFASSPGLALNGSIIIAGDPSGAICQDYVGCSLPNRTLWVFALLQGASAGGITGAEYSVAIGTYATPDEGAGEDLSTDPLFAFGENFSSAMSNGATIIGSSAFGPPDPADRGVNVAWPACQTGDGTKVLLQTVIVGTNDCSMGELRLRAIKKDNESNVFFQCPLFTLCDAPVFTKVCLGVDARPCTTPFPPFPVASTCSSSGEFVINPQIGTDCTIAVAKRTWGEVKGLYSN